MSDTNKSSEMEILIFMTQSELARHLSDGGRSLSRQAVSKRLKNPSHRSRVRFDDSGRVCLQDYINLPKLSPGRKVQPNVINIEPA